MLLYLLIFAALTGLWLFAIVDGARIPESAWAATGRSKTAWLTALVILYFAGPVVYLVMIRRSLKEAQRGAAF